MKHLKMQVIIRLMQQMNKGFKNQANINNNCQIKRNDVVQMAIKQQYNKNIKYKYIDQLDNMNFFSNESFNHKQKRLLQNQSKIINLKTQENVEVQNVNLINHRFNNLITRDMKSRNKKLIETTIKTEHYDKKDKSGYSLDKTFDKQDKKINTFIFNFEHFKEPRKIDDKKIFVHKRYKKKILPHLIVPKQHIINDTIEITNNEANRKNKMLDLMIDILKDPENHAEKQCFINDKLINKTLVTPITNGNKIYSRVQRLNTDPSSEFIFRDYQQPQQKLKKKYKAPKVIENQILKHSNNLNIIRKKLFSEHRNRQENKSRVDLKSSQNQRIKCQKKKSDEGELWTNPNIELHTFYPKLNQTQFTDPLQNEFMCVNNLDITAPNQYIKR